MIFKNEEDDMPSIRTPSSSSQRRQSDGNQSVSSNATSNLLTIDEPKQVMELNFQISNLRQIPDFMNAEVEEEEDKDRNISLEVQLADKKIATEFIAIERDFVRFDECLSCSVDWPTENNKVGIHC